MFDSLKTAWLVLRSRGRWHVHYCHTCGDPVVCGDESDLGKTRYCEPCERAWLEEQSRSLALMLTEAIAYGGKHGNTGKRIVH